MISSSKTITMDMPEKLELGKKPNDSGDNFKV
jgi:hypothetical protein